MVYFGLANVLFLLRYALASAQNARRQFYYIVLLTLFIFSAFRFQVGCDWSGYYHQFLIAKNIGWSFIAESQEPIWWAILYGINAIDLPYPVANVISSAVFFIGVHVLARRQPDPLACIALMFPVLIINMPMSGIRQGAAIGIICIAFTSFADRRPICYTLWVAVAAGFHASALIFLLLLPVATGRYTNLRLTFAALLSIPGAYFLVSGENGEIASSRYIETSIEAFGAVFRVGILGLTALYFFLFLRKKWLRTFPHDYRIVSIGAIGMFLALFLIPISSVISDRFGYYLIPIQAIIFARLPYLPFQYNRALHSAFPYLILLFVFAVWTLSSGHFQQCYIPYNNWIFGIPSANFYN